MPRACPWRQGILIMRIHSCVAASLAGQIQKAAAGLLSSFQHACRRSETVSSAFDSERTVGGGCAISHSMLVGHFPWRQTWIHHSICATWFFRNVSCKAKKLMNSYCSLDLLDYGCLRWYNSRWTSLPPKTKQNLRESRRDVAWEGGKHYMRDFPTSM